ncbi:LOW QUALITY PROTEIN: uncharacterized protein M6D78_013642 [Vipera latastei]
MGADRPGNKFSPAVAERDPLGIQVSPSVSLPLGLAGALCAAQCCGPHQRDEGGGKVEAESSGVTTSLGGFGPVVLAQPTSQGCNRELTAGSGGRGGGSARGAGLPWGCFETADSPRPPPRTAEGAAEALEPMWPLSRCSGELSLSGERLPAGPPVPSRKRRRYLGPRRRVSAGAGGVAGSFPPSRFACCQRWGASPARGAAPYSPRPAGLERGSLRSREGKARRLHNGAAGKAAAARLPERKGAKLLSGACLDWGLARARSAALTRPSGGGDRPPPRGALSVQPCGGRVIDAQIPLAPARLCSRRESWRKAPDLRGAVVAFKRLGISPGWGRAEKGQAGLPQEKRVKEVPLKRELDAEGALQLRSPRNAPISVHRAGLVWLRA